MRQDRSTTPAAVIRVGRDPGQRPDLVATEEPLTIRLTTLADAAAGRDPVSLATTMRTPGHDHELAAGWLAAERLIRSRDDIADISWCIDTKSQAAQNRNVVTVTTTRDALPDVTRLERHGVVTSACGVCGRTTVDDLADAGLTPVDGGPPATWASIAAAVTNLQAQQYVFQKTGGLHAAARASRSDGQILAVREDVGRHNAMDKLIGAAVLDKLPFESDIVLLSGRASYELLQKAVVARVGIVAAVGAPSSLAIEVAERFGITLLGFVRSDGANIYTHPRRILEASTSRASATAATALKVLT